MRQAIQGPLHLERAPLALGAETAHWLGERVSDDRPGLRSFRCDFEIDARTGLDAARHASALVTLGQVAPTVTGWTMAVEWRSGSATAALPVFTGRLNVGPGRLELVGYYTPPGGHRRTSDVAPLNTTTEAAGRWFLRRVAAVL
ncbi:MAG TPA: hypothetical protein VN771_08410 [Candidatus Baltobacteraceae bacterium]|nr:hypothetical protein [Candidatus Baltobacteraceae bacterium]